MRTSTPIWGLFDSNDARALSESDGRFALYKSVNGVPTAVVLESDDIVEITDLLTYAAASMILSVYDGANNAVGNGELISKVNLSTTGVVTINQRLVTPHRCQPGTYPKILSSATGACSGSLHGNLIKVRD